MTKARDLANGGFGLVLIKPSTVVGGTDNGKGTVSFSGVSTVSLNDVFSTTYDNYRILINATGSTGANVVIRYRVSGSDNSTANYNEQSVVANGTSITAARATGATSSSVMVIRNPDPASADVVLSNPFLTSKTLYISNGNEPETGVFWRIFNGLFNATTSFTGFSLIPNSGTMTGTVSVYGFNK